MSENARRAGALVGALLLGACHRNPAPSNTGAATEGGALLLAGARVLGVSEPGLAAGDFIDILVENGRVTALGPAGSLSSEAERVSLEGRTVAPAFIDSHVHLTYRPDAAGMADGGVAAAVDMAAPLASLAEDAAPLLLRASGPMVTSLYGYPTQSWGSDGYGWPCADAEEAAAAVRALAEAGADLIKLPVTDAPVLDEAALRAAVEAAHALGLPVASHALGDEHARLAAEVGADLLAHTPTSALAPETVAAWADGAVVSTLGAFGGSATAVRNLAALRAAGAQVLYGTDFGNTRTAGIDPDELALLVEAGLDGAAILEAGTSAPAARWGIEDLGAIRVGARASLLVLAADPREDPLTLAAPVAVYIDGVKR